MGVVFLDSSAIFALADRDDAAHRAVMSCYRRERRFLTHQGVLMEAFSLIAKRIHHAAALDCIGSLRLSTKVTCEALDRNLVESAWLRCLRFVDKEWDWIDCVSFDLMESRGIKSALSLDHHFRQAGFRLLVK